LDAGADEERACREWAAYLHSLGWSAADIKQATGIDWPTPTIAWIKENVTEAEMLEFLASGRK
jgi:hypothetical protein